MQNSKRHRKDIPCLFFPFFNLIFVVLYSLRFTTAPNKVLGNFVNPSHFCQLGKDKKTP